jgi:hypothetical protein
MKKVLVPESLFDLGEPDLAGEAEVLAVLTDSKFGHRRDSLAAGIAGPYAVSLHIAMVARSRCHQGAEG